MAMEAPVLCFRRGHNWDAPAGLTFGAWADGALPDDRPSYEDLDYHLSTLFPPIRPRGYLEVRYLDAQQGDGWIAPTLLLTALMSDPAVIDQALAAAEPAAGRWFPAAREGLDDKLVLQAARDVVDLGTNVLDRTGVDHELLDQVATRLHCIVDDTHRRRAS
jgi:glutamate--cysteine ligase